MDQESFEDCIRSLLIHIEGEDANREGLQDTPNRVYRMYKELYSGYDMSPEEILSRQFQVNGEPSEVVVDDIPFYSTCEHHMMPFFGKVRITYKPQKGGRIVGLSKFGRLVECYARRLQVQERLGQQIGAAIMMYVQPEYVKVDITAEHTCMTARGIKSLGSKTTTHYQEVR